MRVPAARLAILSALATTTPLVASHLAHADPAAHMMVVAANPLAAQAGLDILTRSGTAVDAAIAVQAVLGLVEPQASGVGGGAMMLTYDAKTRGIAYLDGRETAPAADRQDLFLGSDGKPLPFLTAEASGRAVGVPGAIAMLEAAYKTTGHLKWADLFQPAIRLAEDGFPISPRVARIIAADAPRMSAPMRALYLPGGAPPAAGTVLKNPAYAATLREIASNGADGLLRGRIAADIVTTVRQAPLPGALTADDLAAYRPVPRPPVCGPYRAYLVCSAAPPSAGGIMLLQTLGYLAHFDLPDEAPTSVDAAMAIGEAERLATADRDVYEADPDAVRVPTAGLLAPDYITLRAQLIDLAVAAPLARPGNPDWSGAEPPASPAQPEHGTSDIAIVDAAGDAVSMTTTVEYEFGSQLLVDGFVLNNELTDFSLIPDVDGRPLANRAGPGKRPRSSMAPSIVLDRDRRLVAVLGSAGGRAIPSYVVQAAVAMLDWKLDPARALALGHVGATAPDKMVIEQGTPAAALKDALAARGAPVQVTDLGSGSSAILVTKQGLLGAADPRRDGTAVGR